MKNIKVENLINHDLKSSKFYVYELVDPSTNSVFYIGKGHHYRFRDHLYLYSSNNKHKNNTVAKILKESGYYTARIIYSAKDEEDAYRFEMHQIEQYTQLTNKTKGGSHPESRPSRKIIQWNLFGQQVNIYNSYHEAATAIDPTNAINIAKQILECCRGVICTCGNFYWSYEGSPILKPRTKILPVEQYTSNGQFVTRYSSAAEVGKVLGYTDGGAIGTAIRRGGSYKGYVWKYIQIV